MKKLLILFSTALFLVSCDQTKIAYVDVDEVLKEYKGMKDAQKRNGCQGG